MRLDDDDEHYMFETQSCLLRPCKRGWRRHQSRALPSRSERLSIHRRSTRQIMPRPPSRARKTVSLSHLYLKAIFLPRQARDKHRENSKRDYRFLVREPPPPSLQPVSENSTASLRTLLFRFDKTITGFAKTGFGHTKTRERNGSEW